MRNCRLSRWLFGPRLKELSPPEAGELKELPPFETIVSEPMGPPTNVIAEFRPSSTTAEGSRDAVIQAQEVLILPTAEDKSRPLMPTPLVAEYDGTLPLKVPESAEKTPPAPSLPVPISPCPTYPERWVRVRAQYFSSDRYTPAVVESFLAPD